jgi:hypothetical protein
VSATEITICGHGDDAAGWGELDAVRQEIEQHLHHRTSVGTDQRQPVGDAQHQGNPAVFGPGPDHGQAGFNHRWNVHLIFDQIEAAGLDSRHVQQVVDDAQQMLATLLNGAGVFDIAR